MIKKLLLLVLCVGITSTINSQIKTPQPSPFSKLEQVVGLTDVTIEYSRPSMRDRVIFGGLVPFGKTWRTGANANTKITFSDDIEIDGKELKKGTYAIYTVPNKTSWDIIFYSDSSNWGIPREWDESKVALKTTVDVMKKPANVETFTFNINKLSNNGATIFMCWEKTAVGIPISVPTLKTTMKNIDKAMSGPSKNDYFQAASYFYSEGKDLEQALEWMKKATEGDDEPKFWHLRKMSLIQADLGDKKGAIETAKKSLAGAEKAGNTDYAKMNKDSIAEWSK